jgi:hypothetical protein
MTFKILHVSFGNVCYPYLMITEAIRDALRRLLLSVLIGSRGKPRSVEIVLSVSLAADDGNPHKLVLRLSEMTAKVDMRTSLKNSHIT